MTDSEKEKKEEQAIFDCPEIKKKEKTAGEQKFSKEQLLISDRFSGKRDILAALLSENNKYSVGETEKIIENFMKGSVK